MVIYQFYLTNRSNEFHNCKIEVDLIIQQRVNCQSGFSIKSSLTIPSGVDLIGEGLFKDCSSLGSLIIECDAEIIKEAFYCYGISELTITRDERFRKLQKI